MAKNPHQVKYRLGKLQLLGLVLCCALISALIAWVIMALQPASYRASADIALSSAHHPLSKDDIAKRLALVNTDVVGRYNAVQVTPRLNGVVLAVVADSPSDAQQQTEQLAKKFIIAVNDFTDHEIAALHERQEDLSRNIALIRQGLAKANGAQSDTLKTTDYQRLIGNYIDALVRQFYLQSVVDALEKAEQEQLTPLVISEIASTASVRDRLDRLAALESQTAHLEVQLGAKSTQIKAMKAEHQALAKQLDQEITIAIDNLYSDRDIAVASTAKLRQAISTFAAENDTTDLDVKRTIDEDKLATLIAENTAIQSRLATLSAQKAELVNPLLPIFALKADVMDTVLWVFFEALFAFGFVALLYLAMKRAAPEKSDAPVVDLHKTKPAENAAPQQAQKAVLNEQLDVSSKAPEKAQKTIALFGATAEEEGARMALRAVQNQQKTLLIDVAGIEISRHIGAHKGLSDLLTGDVKLDDVIYNDPETGVDILPNGRVSTLRAAAFSSHFPALLKKLVQDYDVIVATVAAEPFISLSDLLVPKVEAVIVEGKDAFLWQQTLQEAGFANYQSLGALRA